MTLDLTMPKGEIERLRAERDALAKDAARYRWLRTAYFSGNSAYTLVSPTRTAEELGIYIHDSLPFVGWLPYSAVRYLTPLDGWRIIQSYQPATKERQQ